MASLSRLTEIDTQEIKYLGNKGSRALAGVGIATVFDLLHHLPLRYVDVSKTTPIDQLEVGSEVTVVGELRSINMRRPRRGLTIVEARVTDGKASIRVIWFNQPFRMNQLHVGTRVALSGEVESFRGALQMNTPDVDIFDSPSEHLRTGRVVPIYPRVRPIQPNSLRHSIRSALRRSRPIEDPVPTEFLAARGLMARDQAYAAIHFPESMDEVEPARRRLAYDELFRLELALALQKRRQQYEATGVAHKTGGTLVKRFLAGLPYQLTSAQKKVLEEIEGDLQASYPMHRLLQGEVGSGKTVVAVATLLSGVEGGWQGAIMAPTEVLAEQHYIALRHLLGEAGLSPDPLSVEHLGMDSLFAEDGPAVRVALLTGSMATTNYTPSLSRGDLVADIAEGKVDLVVGTHALIQEGVSFRGLGVAVVDEQHRFGVAQRVLLKEKAALAEPDLLIMTATPIPRTLTMTLYGNLDISAIDEMPPGRNPVATRHLLPSKEAEAWELVEAQVAVGRQAFVACPLVEDSLKLEAASAVEEHERLAGIMPELRIGLIHGQLRPGEKEEVMARFRAGEIDVLVSTTVIEVGIDVPNATVMVIEDADRFGLSQLHQLRGRVGRGSHGGTCVLIADPATDEARQRIAAVVASNDGFRLAEEDLAIRGYGTVFGTRQSGMKDLRVADIIKDFKLLQEARRDAFALVESDPNLDQHPELATELRTLLGDRLDWAFIS